MSRTFWLGVFIVGTLLILAGGVFLVGDKDFLFSSTFPLQAEFENVGGLSDGTDVRVGGMREGTVRRLVLPRAPDGRVMVHMKMHAAARNLLRKDSVASIKTAGLLGDEYIEISFGSAQAPMLEPGDTLRSIKPIDVAELTASVAAQTKATLAAVQVDMEALKQNFLLRGYFDKRGYDDKRDLSRNTIAKVPARVPLKVFEYGVRDLFRDAEHAKLGNERSLREAGAFLEQQKFTLALVTVSEAMGDTEQQKVLTQAKAGVVRKFLVENFRLDDTRLKSKGLGKTAGADATGKVRILVY